MGKRDDILNATLELIDEEGLQSVTFAKIFKRAKVGSGTLYNYFQNKDEIVREVFLRCIDLIESINRPADYEDLELIEKFNVLIDIFIQFMINHRKEYMFLENFSSYHLVEERLDIKNYYGILKDFDALIELGQEQGVFREMNPAISSQIISGIISFTYKGSLSGKYTFDDQCIKEIHLSCWKALLK